MPREKKPLYEKYSMERNVTAVFDPDTIEGYRKMSNLDKMISKRQFLRKQPEFLREIFTHCENVPCLEGDTDERFGITKQTCLLCGFRFVPVTQQGHEMSNL
ncbi:MAG: hypothetical protein ACTSQ0_06205, partial [Candidatus Heimdallarchaeota archaeon]